MSPAGKVRGPTPERISVRMYQVGFGDCFLLSFTYKRALPPDDRNERHLLIDFGSTHWPDLGERRGFRYPDIADSIAERTAGKLDVLAITHRHEDHIGGFGNDVAGERIAGLKPSLVLRPWTEDPELGAGARGPRERSRRFAASLDSAQQFALRLEQAIPHGARGLRGELRGIAAQQLPNAEAIERLDKIAATAASGARYLHAGAASGIEAVVPGVGVRVLGPPTIEQWPQVAGEREDDPQYWIRQRAAWADQGDTLERLVAGPPVPTSERDAHVDVPPGPTRCLAQRMRAQQPHSMLRIVRSFDDALNNTSLLLLFEAGGRRLLFPGDAQIENWSYVLTGESDEARELRARARLRQIDLYKVGHHGSRNATPRRLVTGWQERGRPVASLMSTLPGVHGETEATKVPRTTLVRALGRVGKLHRTDRLGSTRPFLELRASTADDKPFVPAR